MTQTTGNPDWYFDDAPATKPVAKPEALKAKTPLERLGWNGSTRDARCTNGAIEGPPTPTEPYIWHKARQEPRA